MAAVLLLAVAVRVVTYLQVRDGSILYFHLAADTDMHFYDGWARLIAGGELLAAPRPYHPWHHAVAREAHDRIAPGQPFDESVGRAMWDHWMGAGTFYQDPLYAYALAASYRIFGPRIGPVLAWQALLGLGIVVLVFVVARTLFDDTVGLVAGGMAALYAPFVFYESTLLRGTLQAFLALAAVACASLGRRDARPWWWLAAGVAAGLSVLTHAANLLLAVALAAAAMLSERRLWRVRLVPYAAGLALAFSPLVARNVVLGLPAWSTGTAAGYGAHNFIMSHAADADPRHGFPFSPSEGRIFALTDARLLPTVRETLATHASVWSWLRLMLAKLLAFFDGWENADNINFYYFLLQSPLLRAIGLRFDVLLPLAALGLALVAQAEPPVRCRQRLGSPPALAVACGVLTALVFFTASRVRLTAAAAMIPFAAAGAVEAVRRLRSRRARSLAGPGAAALAAAVLAVAPWWPRPQLVRDLDYRTGNVLAVARWQHERQQGHPELAQRVLQKQLATEPEPLRALEPGAASSVIPEWAARVAGSFADLHRAAVTAHLDAGRPEQALAHAEHARLLAIVARQFAGRQPS